MVLLNILIKPVWILVENLVQNEIGHAGFGLFSTLFALTTILAVFADFGISHFSTKRIAADPDFLSTYLPVLFPVKSVLSILFPALVVGYGWVLGYEATTLYLLTFIAFSFSLMQYVLFLRGTLQALQQFNIDAWASVMDKLILLVLLTVLFYTTLNLETYVYIRTAAVIATFGVVYWMVFRFTGAVKYTWRWPKVKHIFKASLPFAIISLLYGINERVDVVMLERLYSDHEAGIYTAAYRWVDAIMMYLWTVLPIFFARFALHIRDRKEQKKLLDFGQVIVSVPIIFVSCFVFFYGDKLFWQFTNSTPDELSLMTRNAQILFANVLVHGFLAIYSTLLTSSNYENTVSKLVAVSVVLNMVLNFIFIPEYGSEAAAYNTLASAIFITLGNVILVKKKMAIALPYKIWLKLIAAVLVLLLLFYGLNQMTQVWWLNTVVAGILFVITIFVLQIVRIQDLLQLRKK